MNKAQNREELKFTIIMVVAMITWGYSWTSAKILGPYGDVSEIGRASCRERV